jgi:hypothetical protein
VSDGATNKCPRCGAPPFNPLEYESLREFAQRILDGRYGPRLVESRVGLQEHGQALVTLLAELDVELRQRAACALSGGRYIMRDEAHQ